MNEDLLKLIVTLAGTFISALVSRYVKNRGVLSGLDDDSGDVPVPSPDDVILPNDDVLPGVFRDEVVSMHTEQEYLRDEIVNLSDEIRQMLMTIGGKDKELELLDQDKYELAMENNELKLMYSRLQIENSGLKGEREALLNRIHDMKQSIRESHALTFELITGQQLLIGRNNDDEVSD